MNLFDRYLLKRYGLVVAAVCLLFVTLLMVFLLLDELENFFRYDATWSQMIRFVAFSVPHMVVRFFPLVILLALVFTIHQLMKWGEITAIMNAGASLRRISVGFLVVGVLLGVIQFLANEYGAAWCEEQARQIMAFEIKKRPAAVSGPEGLFVRGSGNRFYHCRYFDRERVMLRQVEIFQPDELNRFLTRYVRAESATYQGGQWVFANGEEVARRVGELPMRTTFERRAFPLEETPEHFVDLSRRPRQMSYRQLKDYMRMLASSGEDPARYRSELHLKLAFPFSCVIFTLVALSVSLRMKAGNVSFELGAALAVAFLYYTLTGFLAELGAGGQLDGRVAAWTPTLLFGGVSLALFLRTRTD